MGGSSSSSAASALKSAYSGYDKAVTSLAIATHTLATLHNVEVPSRDNVTCAADVHVTYCIALIYRPQCFHLQKKTLFAGLAVNRSPNFAARFHSTTARSRANRTGQSLAFRR